jgi:hypothetical protein
MSTVTTIPGFATNTEIRLAIPPGMAVSRGTFVTQFENISNVLSDKPLRRPGRLRPIQFTNEELRRIAKYHPPAKEWLEGDEQRPF